MCVVHRLKKLMIGKKPGEKLFDLEVRKTGRFVKKLAGMIKMKNWYTWVWRPIRCGEATAVTASGMNSQQVMELCQLKSRGVMCYVDEDMVDKALFNEELIISDSEDE